MKNYSINYCPEYAKDYEFMVVKKHDNELWFCGAYENGFAADKIANIINGIVVHNVRIQGKRG